MLKNRLLLLLVVALAGIVGWYVIGTVRKPRPLDLSGPFTLSLAVSGGEPPAVREIKVTRRLAGGGSAAFETTVDCTSIDRGQPTSRSGAVLSQEIDPIRDLLEASAFAALDDGYGSQIPDGMTLDVSVETPSAKKYVRVVGDPRNVPDALEPAALAMTQICERVLPMD